MILHTLTATFGCLNNSTLELQEGLNLIQAPNESGKSTWLAFLRSMLYGLPTRERGALADKNRYIPWNGAAMSGRMELTDGAQELVLVRDTVHGGTPMGRFYAAYAGTATQVEGMTGQNAGERLTGVPRAVFERSAFIRQNALSIDQDAELEKRIAALISSGDETTSYLETEKRLRTALNRRRHNPTGLLPRIEAEIAALRQSLTQLHTLQQESDQARLQARCAGEAAEMAAQKLALHDRMDEIEAKRAFFAAKAELTQTEKEAAAQKAQLEADHIPPPQQLMRIKFNAANLLTTQVSMNHVQSQAEEAKKQTAIARDAVDAAPFTATPEEAAAQVRAVSEHYRALQKHTAPSLPLTAVLTAAAAAALACSAYGLGQPYWITLAAAALPILCGFLRTRNRRRAQELADALLAPYGVQAPEDLEPLLTDYNTIYNVWVHRQENEAQINASWQTFYQNYKKLSAEILEETSSFCPDLENVHQVSPLLEAGLRRWRQLQTLETRAGQLRERCSALRSRLPDEAPLSAAEEALQRPAESRADLEAFLTQSRDQQQEARSRCDRCEGEMAAIGDRLEVAAQLESLEAARSQAQEEYDALALALEELDRANTDLQTRFSPVLGRRAGEIFHTLTGGRYQHVLLDRTLHPAAEDTTAIPRSAALLSQGAADQLYLALRLAISELVLPADKQIPFILDDTLTNFDEARCAAALDFLCAEAARRQILLFTCQSREAVYLQNRKNVHIITLRETGWR